MAIAEMKKFRLVGLANDRARIMTAVSESGVFESSPTSDIEGTVAAAAGDREQFLTERARVSAAIDGITSAAKEIARAGKKKADKKATEKRIFVSHAEIAAVGCRRGELIEKVKDITGLIHERTETRSALHKLAAEENRLRAYLPCTDKFSAFGETEHTFSLLVLARSEDAVRSVGGFAETVRYDGSLFGIIALKRQRAKILDALAGVGCVICPYTSDRTAAEECALIESKKNELAGRDGILAEKIAANADSLTELRLLYDWLTLEAEDGSAARASDRHNRKYRNDFRRTDGERRSADGI